jgi:drug/metabolite transporter (DMT)-like permease
MAVDDGVTMFVGVMFALIAGLMWGLIFIGPVLVPDYPAALQSTGRYLAFGLVVLPLAWLDRRRLRQLLAKDWLEALKLTAIGNLCGEVINSALLRGNLGAARGLDIRGFGGFY